MKKILSILLILRVVIVTMILLPTFIQLLFIGKQVQDVVAYARFDAFLQHPLFPDQLQALLFGSIILLITSTGERIVKFSEK
jgi:hypothetical protein